MKSSLSCVCMCIYSYSFVFIKKFWVTLKELYYTSTNMHSHRSSNVQCGPLVLHSSNTRLLKIIAIVRTVHNNSFLPAIVMMVVDEEKEAAPRRRVAAAFHFWYFYENNT